MTIVDRERGPVRPTLLGRTTARPGGVGSAHPEGVASTTSNTRLLPIDERFPTVCDTLTVGENQYACPPGRPMRRNAAVELVRTVDASIALCGGVTDIL